MTGALFSRAFGFALALLGLAQTLEYASLIDSRYVRATLVFPLEGLEGLFVAAMVFLLGVLFVAAATATRPGV